MSSSVDNSALQAQISQEMNAKQHHPASLAGSDLFLSHSHEDESSVAAELRILLESAETGSLVRDLMSDDRYLLAQVGVVGGLDQGAVRGEAPSHHPGPSSDRRWSHPTPSYHGFNGEIPTGQPPVSRQTTSPMEAQAPFTPTEPAGMMRRGAPAVRVAVPYLQHEQQGFMRHTHLKSALPANLCPYPYHQPHKRSSRGNARKPKTTFSRDQLDLLEMTFATSQYPSSVLRRQLAYISGLPIKTIQTWFQNARVRFRRKQKNHSKKPNPSPSSEPPSEDKVPSPVKSPLVPESPGSNTAKFPSIPASSRRYHAPQVQPSSWSSLPVPSYPSWQLDSYNASVSSDTPSPTLTPKDEHPPMTPTCRPFHTTCPASQPEFLLVFPSPERASHQPANPGQNSWYPPTDQAQLAARPHFNQTPLSTEWYHPRQQCTDLPMGYWGADASWAFPNPGASKVSSSKTPSRDFNPAAPNVSQFDYPYFPIKHPSSATPTIHSWETIYQHSSQHSMASNQQQQVATSPATSLHTPMVEVMPLQYQNPGLLMVDHNNKETASCMVQSRSSHNDLTIQKNTDPCTMSPQSGSNCKDAQSFPTSSSNLRHGFSNAYHTPALPSDHSQPAHPQYHQSCPIPNSTLQHGIPNRYSTPALPSDHSQPAHPQYHQSCPIPNSTLQHGIPNRYSTRALPSDNTTHSQPWEKHPRFPIASSFCQVDQYPAPTVPSNDSPCLDPTGHQIIPSTNSVNQGVASSSNSQLQISAQQVPTPMLDQPLMSTATEPSSPGSDCSFSSSNTLYIDMDAETVEH